MQDEDFDEDEGIYDELNLDEEEEKFGLANDDDSDESEDASDGTWFLSALDGKLEEWCSRHATTDAGEETR